jgi:hypothetical protein
MKKRYKQRKNHWNNSYKYYMDKTIFFCWVSALCSCYIFRRFGAAYRLPLQSEWTGLCGCWIDTEETFVGYVGRFQVVSPIRAAEGGESGRDCASVTHTATAKLCICHAHSNSKIVNLASTQQQQHCASVTHTATATLYICHAHSNSNVVHLSRTQQQQHCASVKHTATATATATLCICHAHSNPTATLCICHAHSNPTATLCICHAHSNNNVLFKVQTQRRLHRRTHQTLYEVIPNIQTCVYCPKLFCWRVWKLQTFVITKDCRIETADKSYFRLIYVSPTIAITSP